MRREGWDLMNPEELTLACFEVVASTRGQTKPDRKLGGGGWFGGGSTGIQGKSTSPEVFGSQL